MNALNAIQNQAAPFVDFLLKGAPIFSPAMLIGKKIPSSFLSSALGVYTTLGSAALLADFYKTRRFMINGRANLPEITRFAVAATVTVLFNYVYWFPHQQIDCSSGTLPKPSFCNYGQAP